MAETPANEAENLDPNELSEEDLKDVSGGNDPSSFDFSDGDLRSSMTGRRPPKPNPF